MWLAACGDAAQFADVYVGDAQIALTAGMLSSEHVCRMAGGLAQPCSTGGGP